ncbi:tripartite tricarboxylate transporter TctB family protein [Martelella mediterranea]|uniref:Tripartite tricarboxylate transporter TctB family protein n=1 Tax=Martelella mediterranea TaxID=293089 RepID=A0A4R3NP02_9HYPH|nr:tripartite tricarboxylate transporter TctB family protein [Martelella mediterranea]TCT36322.1 tripartite tricarboxylate transporter TctB family protein [Martelella mediterranea]
MKKYNVLVAAVSILLGLAIFWFSRGLTTMSPDGVPGEAFWPHMIAWLLIGLGILQLIEVFAFPAINAGREVILGAPGNLWAYLTAAVAFGFATLMAWAGFVIGGVIIMPIVMLIMGERRPLIIGVTTVAAIGVIWFFFVHIFNISLPAPAFLE